MDFARIDDLVSPSVDLKAFAVIGGHLVPPHVLKSGRGTVVVTKKPGKDTVTVSFKGKVTTQSQFQKPDPVVVLMTEQGLEVGRFPAEVKGSNTQYWKIGGSVTVKVSSDMLVQSTAP